MEAKRQRRRMRATLAIGTALAALVLVMAPASVAQAADWRPISGDTWTDTDWFVSENVRTKEGPGQVSATFHNLVKPGSLRFCIHNRECSDFKVLDNSQDIMFLKDGVEFQNSFRRLTACPIIGTCDSHFEGQERY